MNLRGASEKGTGYLNADVAAELEAGVGDGGDELITGGESLRSGRGKCHSVEDAAAVTQVIRT